MKDTDRAEELLRAFYAARVAEARVDAPISGLSGRAGASASADRYARLDSPRAALAAAAAALILMAGIGFGSRWRDTLAVPGCAVSMLADIGGRSAYLGGAIEAIRDSVPRRDMKGERL
jgi:hypothetical protein